MERISQTPDKKREIFSHAVNSKREVDLHFVTQVACIIVDLIKRCPNRHFICYSRSHAKK